MSICSQYSSIAQSVERMTVNHDVTGSSPVRGAIRTCTKVRVFFCWLPFFFRARTYSDISSTGHSSLCELTVKGLPCGDSVRYESRNTDFQVFPRLNAGYRIRGMHESLVRSCHWQLVPRFGEPP